VAEVRAEPENDLARRIFDELKRSGKTKWSGWREPWAQSNGLVLEYTHILSAGERFERTLSEQVDARLRDRERTTELAALRIVALAGAAGAAVDLRRLPQVLDVSADDMARALRRLVEEHLVRVSGDCRLTGLHPLRSAELVRLTHRDPPPPISDTFAQAVRSVPATDVEQLITDAVRLRGVATDEAVRIIAEHIQQRPDIVTLSAALRGFGTVRIAAAVDQWLETPEVQTLPRTQIGTAMMLSFAGDALADINENLARATVAGTHLAELREEYVNDPRTALLEALPDDTLAAIITSAPDVVGLDQLLSALMGLPLQAASEGCAFVGCRDSEWLKFCRCSIHSTGNASNTRASVTSGSCFPSRIASTMSGASSVRRRTRVMYEGAIPSRSASSAMVANSPD
jgi:hypothetical protein